MPLRKASGTLTPQGCPPANPTACNASSQERALWGGCCETIPAPPPPRDQEQRTLTACHKDRQPGEGERLTRNTPHNRREEPAPGQPPTTPMAHDPSQGNRAKHQFRVSVPAHTHPEKVGSAPRLLAPREGSRGSLSA